MADRVTERVEDELAWARHRKEILTRRKALAVIRDSLDQKEKTQAWLLGELRQYPYHLDVSSASLRSYFTGMTRVPPDVLASMCMVLELPLEQVLADDIAMILLHVGPHRRGGRRPGAGRPKGKTS